MKILPDDFAIQLLLQVKEVSSQLFSAILDAVGQNIATSWIGFWDAVFTNEWNAAVTLGFLFFSTVLFGYRLVRNNLLDSIEYLFSKN